MTWIKTVPYEKAQGRLKNLYDRIKGPDNNVDNIMLAHSLRPHSLEGHMQLYKNVLHHRANTIPKWFLEALGIYVSHLNRCRYCVDHHFQGLRRLLDDDPRSDQIRAAINADAPQQAFEDRQLAAMAYAKTLTREPSAIEQIDIEALRDAGWDDGEILEINQVVSYFCYANRMVLGLGVTTKGDIVGLSPNNSDDSSNWSHA